MPPRRSRVALAAAADAARSPTARATRRCLLPRERCPPAPDGTLYVGSLTTGQVVAFAMATTDRDGRHRRGQPASPASPACSSTTTSSGSCSVDTTFQRPTEVRTFAPRRHAAPTFPLAREPVLQRHRVRRRRHALRDRLVQRHRPARRRTALTTSSRGSATRRSCRRSQGAFGLDGIVAVGRRALRQQARHERPVPRPDRRRRQRTALTADRGHATARLARRHARPRRPHAARRRRRRPAREA